MTIHEYGKSNAKTVKFQFDEKNYWRKIWLEEFITLD